MPSLADLRPSERGRLTAVGGPRDFRRRLLELGFLPGAELRLCKVAPLGDPLEVEIRHCRISLRRQEATALILERLP